MNRATTLSITAIRRSFRPLLAAAFISLAATTMAAAESRVLLSYEVTPSAGFDLPNLSQASYADRAAFSSEVLEKIVPKIVSAVGIDAATLETEVTPGGYLLKTNASLQTESDLDDASAGRLAAALGYIFRQYSVLVSRLDDTKGTTGYVTVTFPQDTLDASVAQNFFEKAEATQKGLGGGYTAFGDEQIFLNVTDAAGKPYSGLDDTLFLDGLQRAAAAFAPPTPAVSSHGKASAQFVGNDWEKSPKGEDYISRLGGDGSPYVSALDRIAQDYAALVGESAKRFGWN